jgi:hypothetical protein
VSSQYPPHVPDDRVASEGPWGSAPPPPPPPAYGYPSQPAAAPHADLPHGFQPGQIPPPPDNNLAWGIISTLLCCLPLGVVSIIKASNVNTLWYQGQYAAAIESAEAAKRWAIWSAVASGSVFVVYFLVVAAAAVFGRS